MPVPNFRTNKIVRIDLHKFRLYVLPRFVMKNLPVAVTDEEVDAMIRWTLYIL